MALAKETEEEKPRRPAKIRNELRESFSKRWIFMRALATPRLDYENGLHLAVRPGTVFNHDAAVFRGGPDLRVCAAHAEQFVPVVP